MKTALQLALLVILALAAGLWASRFSVARLANLRLPETGFEEVYVQPKIGAPERCLVGSRAATTAKRSEADVGRSRWRCRTMAGGAVLAVGKSQPTVLFVPVDAVEDPMLPLVREKLRATGAYDGPGTRWVQLFYNRTYRGLHLEIELPGRGYAERRGLGRLEMLTVRGSEMRCWDRKLRPICPIYADAVSDGIFPRPRADDATAFLRRLAPREAETFVISDQDPATLTPLPLPVALDEVLDWTEAPYRDARYLDWRLAPASGVGERFAERFRDRDAEVGIYRRDLEKAVAATARVAEIDRAAFDARLERSAAGAWLARTGAAGR